MLDRHLLDLQALLPMWQDRGMAHDPARPHGSLGGSDAGADASTDDVLAAVGPRLRALRATSGRTLAQLAEATGQIDRATSDLNAAVAERELRAKNALDLGDDV